MCLVNTSKYPVQLKTPNHHKILRVIYVGTVFTKVKKLFIEV